MDFGVSNQFLAILEGDPLTAGVSLQTRKLGHDQRPHEFAPFPQHRDLIDVRIALKKVLELFGTNVLAAGGLKQALLTAGYVQEPLGI